MSRWSEHPARPLTELEVFIGFIINKTGSQTTRQRDYSIKLKDEFERVATTITRQLRSASRENSSLKGTIDTLTLCLAAVHVGFDAGFRRNSSWRHRESAGMQSFKIVAASAFVRELGTVQTVTQGGGFIGTRGGVVQGASGVRYGGQGQPRTQPGKPTRGLGGSPARSGSGTLNKGPASMKTSAAEGSSNVGARGAGAAPSVMGSAPKSVAEDLHNLLRERYPQMEGR
jgi:hypothetical protein